MINGLQLSAAFVVGVLLGGCYFGGLWWTVRRLPHSRHVLGLYFGSLLIRLALILTCFYLVLTRFDWQSLATCLLGFIATRLVITQFLGRVKAVLPTGRAM